VATSGTHDTEPMATWWEEAPAEERQAVVSIPSLGHLLGDDALASIEEPGLAHVIHEALLETLYASGSDTLILPVQDIFGWRDSNQPARDRHRLELDVAAAVAVRSPFHGACRDGGRQAVEGMVHQTRPVNEGR
jgi:hypothetical protein